MILFILIFIIASIIIGFLMWKKSKGLSLIFFSSPIFFIGLIFFFMYYSFNHSSPDSLEMSAHKKGKIMVVSGMWMEHLDRDSFPTDFIVFYVKDNRKITQVNRKRTDIRKEMDWTLLEEDVQEAVSSKNFSGWDPQMVDILPGERFEFSFHLPEGLEPNDANIYYVHIREEPMGELEYWFKKVNMKE